MASGSFCLPRRHGWACLWLYRLPAGGRQPVVYLHAPALVNADLAHQGRYGGPVQHLQPPGLQQIPDPGNGRRLLRLPLPPKLLYLRLQGLGLPVESDVASDPFFGRAGKMMANAQREQQLKFEILCPVISKEKPTAICSFNWHQDHFSSKFGIRNSDDTIANTACLGFGLERVTLALIKAHGYDPKTWPAEVRKQLWP